MHRLSFVILAAVALCSAAPALAQSAAKPAKAPRVVAATSTEIVNLNTATAAQIAALPGIGPKTADLILQYRQKNGSFKKVEEIMNVKGVGEKTFLKLKSRLSVGTPKAE